MPWWQVASIAGFLIATFYSVREDMGFASPEKIAPFGIYFVVVHAGVCIAYKSWIFLVLGILVFPLGFLNGMISLVDLPFGREPTIWEHRQN